MIIDIFILENNQGIEGQQGNQEVGPNFEIPPLQTEHRTAQGAQTEVEHFVEGVFSENCWAQKLIKDPPNTYN